MSSKHLQEADAMAVMNNAPFPPAMNAPERKCLPSMRSTRAELRRSLVVNAVAPFFVCQFAAHNLRTSEVVSLVLAAAVPGAVAMVRVARGLRFDLIGGFALAGLAISLLGVLAGGGSTVVLLRDSFLTGAFAIACFASLGSTRPLMFYVAKRFRAGDDPAARAAFDELAEQPEARRRFRIVTVVWGAANSAEVVLKVAMVSSLSASTVVALSPFLTAGITLATLAWTVRYFQLQATKSAETTSTISK